MATTFKLVVLCSLTIFLFAETCLKNKELLTGERWKQITVDSVLERVPYLRDNMQPIQMARLIDNMSLYLRQELAMIVYTVIDGKTRKVDCFSRQCPWFRDGKMMRDFVDSATQTVSWRATERGLTYELFCLKVRTVGGIPKRIAVLPVASCSMSAFALRHHACCA